MTVPPSLAGIPGINIPVGKNKDGLPIGAQLVGARKSDQMLLNIVASVEEQK